MAAVAAGGSTERVKDRLGCDVGDGVNQEADARSRIGCITQEVGFDEPLATGH